MRDKKTAKCYFLDLNGPSKWTLKKCFLQYNALLARYIQKFNVYNYEFLKLGQ